jgi:GNAT superfamily N-acetyltransferase
LPSDYYYHFATTDVRLFLVQQRIRLIRGLDRQPVEVQLLDLTLDHLNNVETLWTEPVRYYQEEDKYWSWRFKKRLAQRTQRGYEGYAIEYEGCTQGLMMIERQRRSQLEPGQPIVYIDAIASAPWNRRDIQQPPYLFGVGNALLDFARQRSLELGCRGRVGLHALPRSVGFYDRQGMTEVPPDPTDYFDPDDPPLPYFEYRALRP